MPSKPTRRLNAAEIAADEAVIVAIKNLAGYDPAPGMLTLEELYTLNAKVEAKQEAEMMAQIHASAARDAAVTAEWERREAVMRSKAQVIAQFGRDSDEVKAIGLKRQVDRKRPSRRNTTTA